MKLHPLGPNQTQVIFRNGLAVLFSYSTPVAAHLPSGALIRTSERHSQTTSRHINKWIGQRDAMPVSQEELEAAIDS